MLLHVPNAIFNQRNLVMLIKDHFVIFNVVNQKLGIISAYSNEFTISAPRVARDSAFFTQILPYKAKVAI